MGESKTINEGKTFYAKLMEDGTFGPLEPLETTITMKVEDITTEKIEKNENSKEEYDKLLIKVYWLLKGMNVDMQANAIYEILTEIEEFI